jgi:peptidoglycan/LPS O-acetylase OafA/YrhL
LVQGAIDVAIVIVSLVVLLVVEPARLVRRLFAPVDDAVGEPTLYREPGGEVPIAPAQPRAPIAMGRAPAPGYARRALDCYSPAGLRAGLADLWERPSSQLPSLDALRAVAVLLVIASHWYVKDYASAGGPAVSWPSLAENPALALLRLICLVGWTGVDLFFVLSGFLIGGMLWREIARKGTIDFPRFFWRRAFRIWPLYFATLAYAVGMGVLDATPIRVEWSDWLLVSNYVRGGFSRGWTLSTEEQFYIVIPLLLVALVPLFRDRATRRVRLGGFLAALASLELLVLAVRFVQLSGVVARGIDPSHADFTLVYPFHTHVEGLLAGLCIALLTVVRPEWFDRGRPGCPRGPAPPDWPRVWRCSSRYVSSTTISSSSWSTARSTADASGSRWPTARGSRAGSWPPARGIRSRG